LLDLAGASVDNCRKNRDLAALAPIHPHPWEKLVMLKQLKSGLMKLHRDERGAMSVEKILILAIIALPILVVLFVFRKTIVGWFNNETGKLDNVD
jgi:Flp pilus assembly pilin Flp